MINSYKTPFYTKSVQKRMYPAVMGCGSIEEFSPPLKGMYVNVVKMYSLILWSKGTETSQIMVVGTNTLYNQCYRSDLARF